MMSSHIFSVPSHSRTGRGRRADRASAAKRVSFKQLSSTIAILLSTLAVSTAVSARDLTGANTHAEKALGSDPLKASVARWDTNHDGIYTCAEWQAYMTRLFALADIHGSGFLDSKELADVAIREPLFRGASLAFFDSDGDGKISRFEFVSAPSPFFAEFDPEGSCNVTAAALNKGETKSPRAGKSRTAGSAIDRGE